MHPPYADTFHLGHGKSVLIMERCPDFGGEIVRIWGIASEGGETVLEIDLSSFRAGVDLSESLSTHSE